MSGFYQAHKDPRSAEEQLREGWWLKYHPGMGRFYTYDPKNKNDTFGSRGLSKTQVRNLLKKGKIEQVGDLGEIFRKPIEPPEAGE